MLIGARTAMWAKAGGPTPPTYGGLCFTAEAANSSVKLEAVGSAPAVTLVKPFDGVNWSDYTVEDVIELPSVGDFVYLAAGEGGNERFSSSSTAYNKFVMSGLISASGDINSLLKFDLTQSQVSVRCYFRLFNNCTSLTSAPELTATELASSCYQYMFADCSNLASLRVRFTEWPSNSYTGSWVKNVSNTGTFYKPSALPEKYGTNNIPTGWTVVNID